jgi:integrase
LLAAQRSRMETLQQKLGRIITEVFVHEERGPWYGTRIKTWKVACKKAGYPGILIHDLRRSGVRPLVRSGTPERVAMKISGHETRTIFDRDNITSDQDLRDARPQGTLWARSVGEGDQHRPLKSLVLLPR